jgi:DNA-directed RNA polymerase subunit K/omega
MARVTVEDCFDKIPNGFELIVIAAQRLKNRAGESVLGGDSPARVSVWWPRE